MGISDADRTADDTSSLRSAPVAEAEQLGPVQRRLAAALLLLSAVLVVNPIVALALLRSGSEWLAMAAGAPTWFSGADYREGPGTPEPFTATEQPQNLAMAQFPFAGIHNDAAQTDLYPQALAIDPATAQLRTFFAGGGCASLAWDSAGNVAAVCVSDSVTAYVLNGRDLSELARYRLSDRPLTPDFLTDFGGGDRCSDRTAVAR